MLKIGPVRSTHGNHLRLATRPGYKAFSITQCRGESLGNESSRRGPRGYRCIERGDNKDQERMGRRGGLGSGALGRWQVGGGKNTPSVWDVLTYGGGYRRLRGRGGGGRGGRR